MTKFLPTLTCCAQTTVKEWIDKAEAARNQTQAKQQLYNYRDYKIYIMLLCVFLVFLHQPQASAGIKGGARRRGPNGPAGCSGPPHDHRSEQHPTQSACLPGTSLRARPKPIGRRKHAGMDTSVQPPNPSTGLLAPGGVGAAKGNKNRTRDGQPNRETEGAARTFQTNASGHTTKTPRVRENPAPADTQRRRPSESKTAEPSGHTIKTPKEQHRTNSKPAKLGH